MIDKIWQDWVEQGNNSTFATSFPLIPTWNGTISGLAVTNENSVLDSRTDLGIFYSDAANKLAKLELYSVTNNFLATEKFIYRYTITAGNGFKIPNGKKAEIRYGDSVLLSSDFTSVGELLIVKL